MFSLSKKTKGFFIEINEHTVLLARTSSPDAPMVVEELKQLLAGDDAALQTAIKELMEKRSASGYMHSRCAVYPARRLVRRATLDLKRVKDPAYYAEVCTQQFRIEPEKYMLAVLHSSDGTDYDAAKATTQKEVVFVGGPNDELLEMQNRVLGLGIYPERLELGTLSTVGGLVDYLAHTQSKTPTLVLEMGTDNTQSFIVSSTGLDIARPVPHGLEAMIPVVQKELNLKDEESARKLFYSNTFDFTNMGGQLIKKLHKELQSSIGFYEVQTGQSIGQVVCTQLPAKLGWLEGAIAKELGVDVLKMDFAPWLQTRQITFADPDAATKLDATWLGLFSLMASYDAVITEEKK